MEKTVITKLNKEIIENIKKNILMTNEIRLLQILEYEQKLFPLLDSQDILSVIKYFDNTIKKYKDYLNLPKEEKYKIFNYLKENPKEKIKCDRIIDIDLIRLMINNMKELQTNNMFIDFINLYDIGAENSKKYMEGLSKLHYELKNENSKIIKNRKKIESLIRKIRFLEELLINSYMSQYILIINENLENNNINYKFNILETNENKVYEKYLQLLDRDKKVDIMIDNKIVKLSKNDLLRIEAIYDLYKKILKECEIFNQDNLRKGKI